MAKVGIEDPDNVVSTPAPPKPATVDDVLGKWYAELDSMAYSSTAEYAVEGLATIYADTVALRATLSRLDTILSKAHRVSRKLQAQLAAARALLEDATDKLRCNPQALIAKGYAQSEREACYRSSPDFITQRRVIRELERQVSDADTFVKVATAKYRHLEGCRQDQLLQTSLIRLGHGLREHER